MCTAISYYSGDFYFGRNLDLEYHYNEQITLTPRNFPLTFKFMEKTTNHFAILGTTTKEDSFPLYYDAVNEKGLCMAGLKFPKSAVYSDNGNLAPFELIPFVLSSCESVSDAKNLLQNTILSSVQFSEKYPNSPLHFMVSDREESIVIEQTKRGFEIFPNPANVLTNNPPFESQMENLSRYMHLSSDVPESNFDKKIPYLPSSTGFSGIGLPGDWSSQSRFVRACFALSNSEKSDNNSENVSQFFHLLKTVEFPKGAVRLKNEKSIYTVYSCCINASKGIYYYTTYEDSTVKSYSLDGFDLTGNTLIHQKMS